jgi:hypothetical protein
VARARLKLACRKAENPRTPAGRPSPIPALDAFRAEPRLSQRDPASHRNRFRSPHLTSACIVAAAAALLLDGFARIPSHGVHWIDAAAGACFAFGVDWRALFSGEDESTPIDGLLLGALAVGTVEAAATGGRDGSAAWLGQLVAGSGMYFGLTRAMRRDARAVETLWLTLGGLAAALGIATAWAATGGLASVARMSDAVDLHWAGRHVIGKVLVFLTLCLVGRATEHGAQAPWRIATVLAAIGALLHVAAGGLGLDPGALAKLDDPLYFSTLSVTLLLVVTLVREAWTLGRVRPLEASRWRALAVATAALGLGGALGESSGGEGIRIAVGLAAVAVMTARTQPATALVDLPLEPPAPLAEAAAEDVEGPRRAA